MRIRVRTKQSSFEFECGEDEHILYAGLRAGVPLSYECATGTCGTCKARADPGTVDEQWADAPGRGYLKPERGEFLMCQSVPRASCEIRVPTLGLPPLRGASPPQAGSGRLRGVRRLTHDVLSFSVDLGQPIDFLPGQFALVAAPGVPGYRAYSMVNAPGMRERLDFVVKCKPGGGFSEWLCNGCREEPALEVFGPLGRAVFDPEEDKHLLAIAGGSGIAGIMSMLARACDSDFFERRRASLFFGVRTRQDVFFVDELTCFAERAGGGLRVVIALSDEDDLSGLERPSPHISYDTGFVHHSAAAHMDGAYSETVAFVAGPPRCPTGRCACS